jgi:hypothetical protein
MSDGGLDVLAQPKPVGEHLGEDERAEAAQQRTRRQAEALDSDVAEAIGWQVVVRRSTRRA